MKKINYLWYLLFSLIIIDCTASASCKEMLCHYAHLSYDGDVSYLLSYPRSGNTLVRYIFEFVTHRPTIELSLRHSKINVFLSYSLNELTVDPYAKPLWKVHRNRVITAQKFYEQERTKLVFLIRNYKEIAFRYSQFRHLPLFDDQGALISENLSKAFSIWDGDDERELYFQNIAFFNSIPADKKLLIYYEDLVECPEKIIEQLSLFFGADHNRVQELVTHYADYKKRIHTLYNQEEISLSGGDKSYFYGQKYTIDQRRMIDEWVKEHHYLLWCQHLVHYAEDSV